MSVDLGELRNLAGALGLLDADDNLVPDWFSRPGHYLSSVLRDEHQRSSLLAIVGDLLDGGTADTDAQGRQWLPLVRRPDGAFAAYCVIGSAPGAVEIGAGARVAVTSTGGVGCAAQVYLPLFAQPTDGGATRLLAGSAGALIRSTVSVTLPAATSTGGVGLAGVTLAVDIPTAPADAPRFGLTLTGLRLPGAAGPTDLPITADGVADLGTSLLHLVLGLVQAEAAALAPAEPLRGLAAMLGLGTDAVPDFPVEALLTGGPTALAGWLADALGDATARADWMAGLATFVGGTVTGSGPDLGVELPVGPAHLLIGLAVAPVAGGRPRVTPIVTVTVAGAAGVTLALEVEPVTLDLGTGSAIALPALRLAASLRGDPHLIATSVHEPAPLALQADGLDVGFALDGARRPQLVLQARGVVVGRSVFDVLDLTAPGALAEAADGVLAGVAATLLARLGAAGQAVAVLLGLADAPDGTPLPAVDVTMLLHDPLRALAGRWNALLTGPAPAVEAVLGVLRDAIADPAQQGVPVTGNGSAEQPWQVPLAAGVALTGRYLGGVLSVGVVGRVAASDVAGGGVDAGLRAEVTLLEAGLAGAGAGSAVFLPSITGDLRFTATGGGRLAVGSPPLAIGTDALGLAVRWSTGSSLGGAPPDPLGPGLHLQPVAENVRLGVGGRDLALPLPTPGPDGALTLDADGWAAVEALAAAAATAAGQAVGSAWPAALARALGWAGGAAGGAPGRGSPAGPHLALADLVATPEQALRNYAGELLDAGATPTSLTAVLGVLATLLGAPSGSLGSGRPDEPWRLPLLGSALDAAADLVPSLLTSLAPAGPAGPATTLTGGVVQWRPGDPDLPLELLLSSLASEATLDAGLRDLLAARGDLLTGLQDLLARLVGTDGLVTLPEGGLPDGVTPHRLPDLPHTERLDRVDLSGLGLLGGDPAPATVFHVAVLSAGQPDVLPQVPADHVVDLTGAARPPESFTAPVPADPTGAWAVRLGGRADCRLATGDPDGVAGQAARLAATLPALVAAAGGPVLVLAHGGAGHPTVRACAGLAGVAAVVTLGTPWSPVAVDTLDRVPGAEALRLLAALVPAADPDEADDDDLALARQLLGLWTGLDPLPDPLAELRPPGTPTTAGGTPVHAVVGSLAESTLRRAITATVAAALSTRAAGRADNPPPAPTRAGAGLRLPLLPTTARGGLVASLLLDLELAGVTAGTDDGADGTGDGTDGTDDGTDGTDDGTDGTDDGAAAAAEPRLVIRFALGAQTGWLVGGPDPGRAPGLDRPLALRRLTAQVTLPLAGGAATARLDLHDATAFGVTRPVWTVAGGPAGPAGAVPPLPEVRALLAEVATRLDAAAADPTLAAVRTGLAAVGLLSTGGASGAVTSPSTALGIDPVTLQRLFTDPAGVAGAVRSDPARRADLAAALRVLTGDPRSAAAAADSVAVTFGGDPVAVTATLDLAGPAVEVRAGGATGVGWAIDVVLAPPSGPGAVPAVSCTARVGADLPAPAPGGVAAVQGLALLVTAGTAAVAPLTARLRVGRPGSIEDVVLWPAPEPLPIARALAGAAPALLLHALLDGLRERLAGAAPAASAAVEGLLEALGLLAAQPPAAPGADPADPPPPRPLRLPAGLVSDPGAWLRSVRAGPAALSAVVPALVEALRVLLDAGPAPGRLALAGGIDLQAAAAGGRLTLAVRVDDAAFGPPPPAAGRLRLGGSAGLSLDPADPIGPGTRPDVSLSLGVDGIGRAALAVGPRPDGTVGVTLALRPEQGVEIPILPAGPGLGAALAADAVGAAVAALPVLLDAVAGLDPAGDPGSPEEVAGRLVARLGDALGLRTEAPDHSRRFDPAVLAAFGHDPAAALAARAAAIAANGLTLLVGAVHPALGGGAGTVTTADGALAITVGPVSLRWAPGSAQLGATVTVPAGLPGVGALAATVTVDGSGLAALDVAVGPAELGAGPLTLRPFARVRAGSAPPGGRAVEVGLGAGSDLRLLARIGLDGGRASLVASTGPVATAIEATEPAQVVRAAVGAVLELAGAVTLAIPDVATAVDRPLLGTTTRALLTGVLLDPAHPDHVDPTLLDPDLLLHRLGTLLANLAAAPGASVTIDGALTLGPAAAPDAAGGTTYGLRLGLARPFPLGGQDVTVALEADDSWIVPSPGAAGLTLLVLNVPAAGPPTIRPELTVAGVGVRVARTSGPLLATVLTLESVGLSLYADIAPAGGAVAASGGARLELAGLSVGLGGAAGGDNPVASGLLAGNGGTEAPTPRFSPALAIQKHGDGDTAVTVTAGDGAGPWWVVIQRGFGPLYIEQVGLAVTLSAQQLASVGLLVDGRVSLLGLTASVDDLSITYLVSTGSPLDPHAWAVDLAGLAVTVDVGGITLAGGLRKVPSAAGGTEYVGLLMARLAVYGISVYGGYGLVGPPGDRFASLFLFGALNGPVGGPPAFFVTGIGGGFGINRALTYPSDLSQFGTYPFVKALDPAARPGDPMAELEQIRGFFPAQRGSFWFAAGLSFTSFALVDGVAVIAVQIGDGFELALLGLARMALPRPEVALVSVELALLARVSTREGVLLVQAQLTDNSWLLFPSIRLTGGFAFASWFGGPNRGQFVLTLGGYHPSFRRDGYPVVPRLGIAVDLYGFLSITGGAYFALTSEAVMAGASITASATFGPAWVHLTVGGDGIVFFDPFWFDVTVYASISAGISIDVWIGTITISVSLSARVELTGPPFHGRASFSVGPADLVVEFGDAATAPQPIPWAAFVPKYLQEVAPGTAAVLGAIAGRGAAVPAGDATDGAARSPDGSTANPYRVTPEFQLTVTSLAPVRRLVTGGSTRDLPTVPEISAAPMRAPATPTVTLTFLGPAHLAPVDRVADLAVDPQALGSFAVGTWGPAPSQDDAKVPRGDVIPAVDRIVLTAAAEIAVSPSGAPAIPYHQVEVDPYHRRRPLPFVTEGAGARLTELGQDAGELAALVPAVPVGSTTLQVATELLAERAGRSPADVDSWSGDRRSSPMLASLGEGLGQAWVPAAVAQTAPPPPPAPAPLRPPSLRAVLMSPIGLAAVPTVQVQPQAPAQPGAPVSTVLTRGTGPVTTVSDALLARYPGAVTAAPPALPDVDAGLVGAVPARLLTVADPAQAVGGTVLAAGALPPSRSGRSGVELVAGRGQDPAGASFLSDLAASLRAAGSSPGDGMQLAAGAVAVLQLPDADRDVDPGRRPVLGVSSGAVTAVAVGPGGRILAHQDLDAGADLPVPAGTRVVAVHPAPGPCLGTAGQAAAGPLRVFGWDAATPLPYLGDEVLLAAGAVLASSGRVPWRRALRVGSGCVAPDTVVAGPTAVTTRFAAPVTAVAVALEGGAGEDDVALGLDGADRPLAADGRPLAPVLVADGARAVAVFVVQPAAPPDGTPAGVSVTVTTGPQRRLAGVAAVVAGGVDGGVAALAAAVAQRGFADVVPDPVPTGIDGAVLLWKEP